MKSNKKKMVAPIMVSILLIAYYVIYFGFIISTIEGKYKYAFGIFPIIFTIMILKVCVERLNEINGGEEDDISKY